MSKEIKDTFKKLRDEYVAEIRKERLRVRLRQRRQMIIDEINRINRINGLELLDRVWAQNSKKEAFEMLKENTLIQKMSDLKIEDNGARIYYQSFEPTSNGPKASFAFGHTKRKVDKIKKIFPEDKVIHFTDYLLEKTGIAKKKNSKDKYNEEDTPEMNKVRYNILEEFVARVLRHFKPDAMVYAESRLGDKKNSLEIKDNGDKIKYSHTEFCNNKEPSQDMGLYLRDQQKNISRYTFYGKEDLPKNLPEDVYTEDNSAEQEAKKVELEIAQYKESRDKIKKSIVECRFSTLIEIQIRNHKLIAAHIPNNRPKDIYQEFKNKIIKIATNPDTETKPGEIIPIVFGDTNFPHKIKEGNVSTILKLNKVKTEEKLNEILMLGAFERTNLYQTDSQSKEIKELECKMNESLPTNLTNSVMSRAYDVVVVPKEQEGIIEKIYRITPVIYKDGYVIVLSDHCGFVVELIKANEEVDIPKRRLTQEVSFSCS